MSRKSLLIAVAIAALYTGTVPSNAAPRPVTDAGVGDLAQVEGFFGEGASQCFIKILKDSIETGTTENLTFDVVRSGVRFWDKGYPGRDFIMCNETTFSYVEDGQKFETPYVLFLNGLQ